MRSSIVSKKGARFSAAELPPQYRGLARTALPMILVTGGAGYIGSHFIKRYLEKHPDERVVVLDNLSQGHPESLDFSDRITLIKGDIGDRSGISELLTRYPIDLVVHFAASCKVSESQQEPDQYFQNNVIQSLALIAELAAHSVRKIIFSSSCAIYGKPHTLPLDEAHPQQPVSVYGTTKLMVEEALSAYYQGEKLSSISLRYFNAAGSDESGLIGESRFATSRLIPLVLQVANGQQSHIDIYGNDYETPDGTCIRDFIHVNDLAEAHCLALDYLNRQEQCNEAFNLGSATGTSVQTIVERCRTITGHPIPSRMSPRRPGDLPHLVANTTKAKTVLGWEAVHTVDHIIQTAWHWEQKRRY